MRSTRGTAIGIRTTGICSESFLLLAALMLFLFIALFPYGQCQGPSGIVRSDTVYRADTLYDTVYSQTVVPVPYLVETVRHDTVMTERGDTVVLPVESKAYRDTLASDGDTAIVSSWVSGYRASLDSVRSEFRSRHIVETVTVTNTVRENKRLGVFIGPTLGYDPVQGRLNTSISIGIGIIIR